jgi:hypothetical protein
MRGDSTFSELKIKLPTVSVSIADGGIFSKFLQICNHIHLPSNISKEALDSFHDYCAL